MQSSSFPGFDIFLRQFRAAARVEFARMMVKHQTRVADAKLFGATFAGGFVFTALLIA